MEKLSERLRREKEAKIQRAHGPMQRWQWMQAERDARHLAVIIKQVAHYTPGMRGYFDEEIQRYGQNREDLGVFGALVVSLQVKGGE